MEPLAVDTFWKEEIEEARKMSPQQKLRAGADLFDYACQITLAGIRFENPGITYERALQILRERLELGRRLEATL